ncbi:MAG: Fur family transcriptional regulator [Dehalococcoidales bacterium]|nr:Fur family transcriptional regulator [Dehalococcoidales bacterium]
MKEIFNYMLTEKNITTRLRQQGYKLTRQRRAVLGVIARSHEHLTPAAIYERVRREDLGIGLVTVYRTLETLVKLGLVCEVHIGGNCRSYLVRASGHHHHLVCSDCGKVVDFNRCNLEALEKKLHERTGFNIDGHLLEFTGQCRDCGQAQPANKRV